MSQRFLILAVFVFFVAELFPASSQIAPAPTAEFEVASIKPNRSGNGVSGGCHGVDSKPDPESADAAIRNGVETAVRACVTVGLARTNSASATGNNQIHFPNRCE